jgi:hypothetical protein
MSSGYEIRHALLNEARDLLMHEWHEKCNIERDTAQFEQRPPRLVPSPSFRQIKELAVEMYDFVKTKE